MKMDFALKTGAAALTLCMLAGNAWAAASCARPQDVTALQAAALQQQLMVAAFACNDTADYNRFVTSYQSELQKSDQALMSFFLRQDAHKGTDGYNAYKTRLANAASLRSLHDPQFCRSAQVAFDVAFKRKGSLAELASERPSLIETDYASCMPGARETILMADAAPSLPARHQALPGSLPSASIIVPKLAPRPDRALPPISPQRYALSSPKRSFGSAQAGKIPAPSGASETTQVADATPSLPARHQALPDSLPSASIILPESTSRDAYDRDAQDAGNRDGDDRNDFGRDGTEARDDAQPGNDAPSYDPRYADAASARGYYRSDDGYGDNTGDDSSNRDGTDNGPTANNAGDYRDAYYVPPYAYRPYAYAPYVYRRHAYGPPARPRLVRGPYGRWYLLPPYGR